MQDVATAVPDSLGYYEFAGLKPGWYAVHFLWNISEKPSSAESLFKEGHWGIMSPPNRPDMQRCLHAGSPQQKYKHDPAS